ncbi:Mucin-16, partial [Heterocephalus glaber]
AAGPILAPFTINFTILNLEYEKDMHETGSQTFNFTDRVLQKALRRLFKNTTISPLYSGCRLTLLRPEKDGSATGVDIVCTYHPEPMGLKLDREQLYWELSQLTHEVTHLGHYSLEKNSLYVDGYTNRTVVATPSVYIPALTQHTLSSSSPAAPTGPALVPFTLNFTITNLPYEEDMQPGESGRFSTMEKVLQDLLRPLFKNTTVGSLFSACTLTLLRSEKGGSATGVDTVCTYHPGPVGPTLDRKQLYRELIQLTHNVTQLGSYTLDQNSLYINGYTHQTAGTTPSGLHSQAHCPLCSTGLTQHGLSSLSSPAAATEPPLVPFTLNFTITNLPYEEDMWPPGSWRFNNTEKGLQDLLKPLFKNTAVASLYSGCRLILLRPKKDKASTGVDMVCTYHSDPAGPGLDREQLHWELRQGTHGVTQLGPYTLDQDSLYING